MREADGFILASPTYYAGIAGTMKAFWTEYSSQVQIISNIKLQLPFQL